MTWKATQVVLEESKHKGSALLLLLILANHAHEDGRYAFPSVATMARYTRMGRRNVQTLLRKLEASGELQEMGIHNSGTVIYRIVLPGLERGGAKFAPPAKKGAQARSPGGDQAITGGAITDSPEPSVNQQEPSEDQTEQRVRITPDKLTKVFGRR